MAEPDRDGVDRAPASPLAPVPEPATTARQHEQNSESDSLFDPIEEQDGHRFGTPGPALSRSSAFYKGLWGAIGVLLAIAVGLAVREVASVLVLVLVSAFLAVGLNPIVELLIRLGVKRGWAVLIVSLVVLGVITVVLVVLIGVLRNQISSFVNNAPHLLDTLRRHKTIRDLDDRYHFITDLQNRLKDPNLAADTLRGVFNTGLAAAEALANTVIVIVLTIYFLGALPHIKRGMYTLAPASRRDRVGQLGDEILRRIGRYVIGASLVALLAGTVTFVFLLSSGLGSYALPLALLVALLDLVPIVGSVTGAAIVTLVSFATSLDTGIAALTLYVIYEPLEGYVIYPRVMRSSVDVPEYVTIIAVLMGGALAGIVGALLALPIAAAAMLLVREVWVRRQDAV